jgi:hypothetical protein
MESIREGIVMAYFNFPLKISKTLRPGIMCLVEAFFPRQWDNLITSLVGWASQNPQSITAVLKLMENITHKYSYLGRSDELYE